LDHLKLTVFFKTVNSYSSYGNFNGFGDKELLNWILSLSDANQR